MTGETSDTLVSPQPPPLTGLDWFVSRLPTFAQIIAVSGFPTQLLIAAVLIVGLGMSPYTNEGLSLQFIATVSFIDTALVALLILVFLRLEGEHSHTVFFGGRRIWPEFWRGLVFVPVLLITVTAIVSGLRYLAPWLNTVPENPLAAFMTNPFDAAIFTVMVILAGGVREELQRAFILHRWRHRLGNPWTGNLLFGLLFGALHIEQGYDLAVVIGLMGMVWGATYLRRRSVVAGMVNHAGFNTAMVVQQLLATSLGLTK